MLGESPAAQSARIEEASKGANDLTGLVKKKKPVVKISHTSSEASTIQSNGKRKADSDMQGADPVTGKKARTEGVEED